MKFLTVACALLAAQVSGLSLNFKEFLQTDSTKRLIKLGPGNYEIATEDQKLAYKRRNVRFIDVSGQMSIEEAIEKGLVAGPGKQGLFQQVALFNAKQVETVKEVANYSYPTKPQQAKLIRETYHDISVAEIKSNLANFTLFYTRYYKSESGYDSAIWLQSRIDDYIEPARALGVTKTRVNHEGWDQFSIIVSIPGKKSSKNSKGPIVVVGAHQDSINLLLPNLMRAPGADDDGSGTVTTLEALRLTIKQLVAGNFVPENTLEFHFYSAEEGGLLGSADVFHRYSLAGHEVVAMLQQDMTGYTATTVDNGIEKHVGLIVDYTNPRLNEFLKLVITNYCSIPYHETTCGYACLDHASAIENGYPSAFIIELEFSLSSSYIHLVLDTIDRIDFDHVREHVKLTLAYAIELASATVEKVK